MRFSRRAFLAATLSPLLPGCSEQRRIIFLGENVPGVAAIGKVAKEASGNVALQFVLDEYEPMAQKANTDFASRTGNYDVVLQYNAALANYVRNNYIVPLSEFSDQAWVSQLSTQLFLESWKEIGWYQSPGQREAQAFGVPFSANSMVLCCKRSLFESAENRSRFERQARIELKPPKTWDEFERAARFFTSADTRGVALQGADLWIYYEWANFAFSNGGGVMRKKYGWISDENTPVILSSQETIAATERYLRLKAYSQFGQPNADLFATDAAGQVELMKSGRYAMAIMWSDVAYNLVRGQSSWSDAYTFHVIPGSVSMLAGGSYYINRQSKSRDRAIEIIQRLFEPEQQAKLARLGLCPPRRSIYLDDRLKEEIPYLSAVGDSLQRGTYMLEAGPDADETMQIVSRALQEMLRAGQSAKVASRLAAAQEEIAGARAKTFELLMQQKSKVHQ